MSFRIFVIVFLFSISSWAMPHELWGDDVPMRETEQIDFAHGLLERGLFDMAVDEYQKFIAAYPQSTYLEEANFAIGESYFLAKNFPKATEAFNHFKELYPNGERFPFAVLRLGQIEIESGKFDEAIGLLTSLDAEAKLKGPLLQSFEYYSGKAYRRKNDTQSALKYFQKAAEVSEGSNFTDYAYEEMAEIHSSGAHYEEAIQAYTKAVQSATGPERKGVLIYKLGESYFLAGKYQESIGQFQTVLDQYSNLAISKEAVTNLLLANFNLGSYQDILINYQNDSKFIKEDGAYFDIHFAVVRAYVELKEYDEAMGLLEKIVSWPNLKDEDKRQVILKKADILIKQKKFTEGLALSEGALPGQADDGDKVAFLKSQGYFGMGDYQKAFDAYQDIRNKHPSSNFARAALLGMAHSRYETENYPEAAKLFYDYVNAEEDPALKSEALFYATLSNVRADQSSEAISRAEEYLKTFPTGTRHEEAVLLLCELYGKNNWSEKAVNLLDQYLTHPDIIQNADAVQFLLGYNQQLLGHNKQALESYGKIPLNKDHMEFYASALKNTAVIYLAQKNEEQAVLYFDKMITELSVPDLEMKTYLWVCEQYLKGKKFNDVLRIAEKAEARYPDQEREKLAYFKAEANRELKNFDKAGKLYDTVLSLSSKNTYSGAAHIGKGLCLLQAKDWDQARQEFKKAIDENSDDATLTLRARFEMGNIAYAEEKWEEALKFYLLIGTIYDDQEYCPEALKKTGELLEKLKRPEEALKAYQDAVKKYRDSPAALFAQERIKVLSEKQN